MNRSARLLLALGALTLGLLYVLPLWRVTLEAPQYPEGIGMLVWIDTITGVGPHDLKNINGLNHYIGMQAIVPDAIPELKVMPWLFGALLVLGLGAAAWGRRAGLYAWLGSFALVMVLALVDFYRWGYDYGHNLDPEAAIQVPGMTYQPPVLGSKQLLNFTAHSWPAVGGWVAVGAFALGLAALWMVRRDPRPVAVKPA